MREEEGWRGAMALLYRRRPPVSRPHCHSPLMSRIEVAVARVLDCIGDDDE